MVLVDTSVWIRFLANRAPYAAEWDRLLDRGEAAGHDLIYGELLIGDPGGREPLLSSFNSCTGWLRCVIRTSSRLYALTNCMDGESVGSTRICSPRRWWPTYLSGQRTTDWPTWPANSESGTFQPRDADFKPRTSASGSRSDRPAITAVEAPAFASAAARATGRPPPAAHTARR